VIRQEAHSAGIRLPRGVQVGSGVPEVLAAFVTTLAGALVFFAPGIARWDIHDVKRKKKDSGQGISRSSRLGTGGRAAGTLEHRM